MTTLSKLKFPRQMRPELARHVADALCWAPSESPESRFMCLAIMWASWASARATSLSMYNKVLASLFTKGPAYFVSALLNEDAYDEKAAEKGVGSLTLVHAKQAIRVWAEGLEPNDAAAGHAKLVLQLLAAAVEDKTEASMKLSEQLKELIEAYSGTDAGDDSQPVMLMGPNGPIGPFLNRAAAQAYQLKARAAAKAGLPLPAIVSGAAAEVVPENAEAPSGPGVQVYSTPEVIRSLQKMPPMAPGEGNGQQRRMLELMASNSGWRPLSVLAKQDALAAMYSSFPHFKPVLDFISERLALAGCGTEGNPIRLPPILLRGEQGTGKSYFAKKLAKALGTEYVERDLSVMTASFVITGMDSGWKGSKPGIVFDALVTGKTANPVICLNEIDKVPPARGTENSPIAPLFTLLERESANIFTDEFIPVPIDASEVIWIFTANNGDIMAPILERMEVFDIPVPTKEECRIIAASVWDGICQKVLPKGHPFAPALEQPLLDVMSAMRPRVMRKTLTHAAGRAAIKGMTVISVDDLQISQKRYETAPARSMGFIP